MRRHHIPIVRTLRLCARGCLLVTLLSVMTGCGRKDPQVVPDSCDLQQVGDTEEFRQPEVTADQGGSGEVDLPPCAPDCEGKECGHDGCGGVCGQCGPDQVCVNFRCPPPGMQCDDGNDIPWDGCTDGKVTEFRVSQAAIGHLYGPAVVALSNGGFVVAWERTWIKDDGQGPDCGYFLGAGGDGVPGRGVFLRRYASDGTPLGDEERANQTILGDQENVALAPAEDGGFLVAWQSCPLDGGVLMLPGFCQTTEGHWYTPDGTGCGVVGVRYQPDGTPGQEVLLNPPDIADETSPYLLPLAGGGFVGIWEYGAWSSFSNIWAASLDDTGQPDGFQIPITQYNKSYQRRPRAVQLESGAVMLAWRSSSSSDLDPTPAARVVDLDGQFQTDVVAVAPNSKGGESYVDLLPIVDDEVMLVWRESVADTNIQECKGRRFNTLGVPVSSTIDLVEYQYSVFGGCQFGAMNDGSLVATYGLWPGHELQDTDPSIEGIFAQFLDASGQPLSDRLAVSSMLAGVQDSPRIAVFPNGTIIIVWSVFVAEDNEYVLFAQRFDAQGHKLYR